MKKWEKPEIQDLKLSYTADSWFECEICGNRASKKPKNDEACPGTYMGGPCPGTGMNYNNENKGPGNNSGGGADHSS